MCCILMLNALSSVIEGLEKKLSIFLVPCASPAVACGAQPAVSYASAPTPIATHSSSVVSRKRFTPQRSSSADERASNNILSSLGCLVESKQVVDEILEFVSGNSVQIKDMLRLGKYVRSTSSLSHPRPIQITARDCFTSEDCIKDFRIKHLFLREDVPPDHKLRARKPIASLDSTPPGDPSVDAPVSSVCSSSTSGAVSAGPTQALTNTLASSAQCSRCSVSPAVFEASSQCPVPICAVSQTPSHPYSSSFSVAQCSFISNDGSA